MSDLVGNPNCWFCHAQAHILMIAWSVFQRVMLEKWFSTKCQRFLFSIIYKILLFLSQIKTGVQDLSFADFCTDVSALVTCLTPTEEKISITYDIMKEHLGLIQKFADLCQMPGTNRLIPKNIDIGKQCIKHNEDQSFKAFLLILKVILFIQNVIECPFDSNDRISCSAELTMIKIL